MISFHGYKLHVSTYRQERKDTSAIISKVRSLLLKSIENAVSDRVKVNTAFLVRCVRDPAFFLDIDLDVEFEIIFSKALNEVILHTSFYLHYAEDLVNERDNKEYNDLCAKEAESKKEVIQDNKYHAEFLCGIVDCLTDSQCKYVVNSLYCNNRGLRSEIQARYGGLSNFNHRSFLNDYICYCALENSCTDDFILLSLELQEFYKKFGFSVGYPF